MFKKLKDKIAEEVKSSPQRIQQLTQSVTDRLQQNAATNDVFTLGDDDTPPSDAGFTDVSLRTPTPLEQHRTRRYSSSSMASSDLSFLPQYEPSTNLYHVQSDLDVSASEIEDNASMSSQHGHITKEQVHAAFQKAQMRYHKYRGRYSDLQNHYRLLEKENAKIKAILVETQDKAIRRVSELREQCTLEQKAKAHLENALRVELDERQIKIDTLETKIELLKNVADVNTTPEDQLSDARAENERLNAKLQELKANGIIFNTKEGEYKLKLRELERALQEKTAEHAQVCEREKETSLKLAQVKLDLHSELHDRDLEISSLKQQQAGGAKIENLQSQNAKLIEKVEALAQKCQSYEGELIKLEQYRIENLNLNETVASLKRAHQDHERKVSTENERLHSELQHAVSQLKESESSKVELDDLKGNHSTVLSDNERFRSEVTQLQEALQLNETKLKESESLLVELGDLRGNLATQLQEALQLSEAKLKESESLKIELEGLRGNHLIENERLHSELTQLQEALQLGEAKLRESESVKIELEGLRRNQSMILSENESLHSELTQLQEALQLSETTLKESESLKIELEGLRGNHLIENERFHSELTQLQEALQLSEAKLKESESLKIELEGLRGNHLIENERFHSELTQLQEALQLSEAKLKESESLKIELEGLRGNHLIENERLRSELTTQLQEALQLSEAKLKESESVNIELEGLRRNQSMILSENERLHSELTQLQLSEIKLKESESLKTELEGLRRNQSMILSENESLHSNLKQLQEALQYSEMKLKDSESLQVELRDLRVNHSINLSENERLHSELTQLQEALQLSEAKLKESESLKSELEVLRENHLIENERLHSELTHLQEALQLSEAKLKESESLKIELEGLRGNHLNENERFHSEVTQLQEALQLSEVKLKESESVKIELEGLRRNQSMILSENESLHSKLKQLQEALQLSEAKLKESESLKSELEVLRENHLIENERLHSELTHLQEALQLSEAKLKESESLKIEVEGLRGNHLNENERLHSELTQLQEALQLSEAKVKESEVAVEKIRADAKLGLLSLEARIKEKVVAEYDAKEARLKDDYREKLRQLTSSDAKITEVQLLESREAVAALREKLEGARRDLDEAKEGYGALETDHLELIEEGAGLRKAISEKDLELSRALNALASGAEECRTLRSEIALQQDVSTTLQNENAQLKAAQLETGTLKEKEEELDRTKRAMVEVEAKFAQLNLQQGDVLDRLAHLEHLCEKLQREKEALVVENGEQAGLLKMVRDYEKQLAAEHAELKAEHEDARKKHAEREEKLEETAENLRRQNAELGAQLGESRKESEGNSLANAHLRGELSNFRAKHDAAIESALSRRTDELEELQRRNLQLAAENRALSCKPREGELDDGDDVRAQLEELERHYGEIERERQLLKDEIQELKTTPVNNVQEKHAKEVEDLRRKLDEYKSLDKANRASIDFYKNELQKLEVKNEKLDRKLDEALVPLPSMRNDGNHDELGDSAAVLEYLRNVLFNYMTGKESLVLAKVIAAVCKFDVQQTELIVQREQQKQTLLGHLFGS